jgi:hypothetical protein
MTMHRLTIAAALALAACAPAAPPIIAYDVPYTGKFGSVRPEPRPAIIVPRAPRWPGCDPLPEDCGSGDLPEVFFFEDINGNRHGPFVEGQRFTSQTPPGFDAPTPQPEATPPEPQPEPPEPEPPTPEPETPVEPGPAGQNPGNSKPVGNAPFDGERGREPSGKGRPA